MYRNYSAEKILEALNKYYAESIFITDGEGNVIFVNEQGAANLGTDRENLMYKNVRELMSDGIYEKSTVLMAIETKQESTATINPQIENSSVSHSVPIFDDDGNITMVITNNMTRSHGDEWKEIFVNERNLTERLRRELDNLKTQSDKSMVIANSPEMKKIYNSVAVIAPTDSNVIILGESGTGKDVMAKYIHEHSARSGNAFISINCAAIPENLLESELFGYDAGAFSGALSKGKIGLFEAASGGTIFLDEIGDMPLTLQSKLLRALENQEIRRVGGVKNIPIDVRVLCATNVDLMEKIKRKEFREDLYYRISVFTIELPPLRNRKEDIIPLANCFLSKLNEKYNTRKYFSDVTVDTMINHEWPGNIRELRNVVERIFVVSYGDELQFTPTPTADLNYQYYEQNGFPIISKDYDSLKEFLETAEAAYIERISRECGGSVSKTAEKLGIHRSALYRKTHKK